MIRFLKNIKIDSELDIQLSSFDINAICYQIDKSLYISKNKYELIEVIFNQLNSLAHNINYLENLKSVDEREYIFRGKESKINSLILLLLLKEVYSILEDLKRKIFYNMKKKIFIGSSSEELRIAEKVKKS
ncbi:hypothetical protein AANUM_1630 [Aggregatibacter actinomycetemcomitans NUM4039]|nr:hypothetical protein [Aggregatibacter actinomycetemcomitans]BAS48861.1 hypothetical protein AANUM_1630 [Aggregatibacter actinomycetemcomitans NUM4039]